MNVWNWHFVSEPEEMKWNFSATLHFLHILRWGFKKLSNLPIWIWKLAQLAKILSSFDWSERICILPRIILQFAQHSKEKCKVSFWRVHLRPQTYWALNWSLFSSSIETFAPNWMGKDETNRSDLHRHCSVVDKLLKLFVICPLRIVNYYWFPFHWSDTRSCIEMFDVAPSCGCKYSLKAKFSRPIQSSNVVRWMCPIYMQCALAHSLISVISLFLIVIFTFPHYNFYFSPLWFLLFLIVIFTFPHCDFYFSPLWFLLFPIVISLFPIVIFTFPI